MKDIGAIVIGAGASGLMAARELGKAGKRVLVLEARDRIGGRIWPLDETAFGYPAQGGAEFVHGAAAHIRALADEAGLAVRERKGGTFASAEGAPRISWQQYDSLLADKLALLEADISIEDFLSRYFAASEFDDLRAALIRRTQSYEAGDAARASSFALRDALADESGSRQGKIQGGYGALLGFLETEIRARGGGIVLRKEVAAIDAAGNRVRIRCADGSAYEAAQAIVSVPLPLIETISFSPEVPEKIAAVKKMGFGGVIKILLHFSEAWWRQLPGKQDFDKLSFLFSQELIPTWWTQFPDDAPTLTGWLAGPASDALAGKSESELLGIALSSAARAFGVPEPFVRERLARAHVANWPADRFARGAYSYATFETAQAREILAQPIARKVFFCGEAFSEKEYGTVEGALESGKAAATRALA